MIRIRAWALWLQCILLDESITALLHDGNPTLSVCAWEDAARGGRAIKATDQGRAESAASRRRLVRRDGVDVQVHLPQACAKRGI